MFSTANADSSSEKLELWNKITQIAGDAILELNLSEVLRLVDCECSPEGLGDALCSILIREQ